MKLFTYHLLCTLCILGYAASATIRIHPPDGFSNRTQLLAAAKNVSAEAFTRTTNASLGARLITCDERAFGHLDLISCMNAASQISLDLHLREFRERYTVRMGNIPQRWISRDGLCAFDLTILGRDSAHASFGGLSAAADNVIQDCIVQGGNIGGRAAGLGLEETLGLEMRAYHPTVQCFNPLGAAPQRCSDIIRSMPIGKLSRRFGPRGTPGIDVPLGLVLGSVAESCEIAIETTGPVDTASWYSIWEAVVALEGMCERAGKVGTAYALGDHGKLFIDMRRGPPAAASS